MEILITILIAIAFIAFIYWRRRANKDPFWYHSPLTRGLLLIKGVPAATVEGTSVFYEKGVERVSHPAIGRGVANVFERLYCRYPANRENHDIKVCVLQGERAPESGTWAFRVAIGHMSPYFNSEWDMMRGSKDGVHYVLAAGQLAAVGEPDGDIILIPSAPDEKFIETITEYEFEHAALAWYDGDEYERTKYHGEGTGHPIISPCPGSFSEPSSNNSFRAVDFRDVVPPPSNFTSTIDTYSCILLTK